jgi:hypothetical protein
MFNKIINSLMFDEADGLDVSLDNNTGDDKSDLDLLNDDKADDKDDKGDDDTTDDEDASDDTEGDNEDGDSGEDKDDEEELDEDGNKKEKKEAKEDKDDDQELSRHSYRDIKAKYPELFKDFPGLKQAFFREQEFTKIFPTVDEARAALDAQENFTRLRDTVMDGDALTLLTQIKEASPEALEKFSNNFLDDLRKVDKQSYLEVTSPVIKNILQQAFVEGGQKRDENLQKAAQIIHQAIFGGDYDDIKSKAESRKTNREDDPERKKLDNERAEFLNIKFTSLRKEVWGTVEAKLTRDIEKGLDPTNSIRPGLKKILIEKIFNEVTSKVASDAEHIKRMDALWVRERKAGYSGQLKESIETTYLSRAKAIVPGIRARIRSEVTGAQKKQDNDKRDKLNNNKKPDLQAGKNVGNKPKVLDRKSAKGMSDMDILTHGVK